MKKLIAVLALIFLFPIRAEATNDVTLYLFKGEGCPHCAEELIYLDELKETYPNLEVREFEVWYNEENQNFMQYVEGRFNELYEDEIQFSGVPVTIIGNQFFVGFSEQFEEPMDELIKRANSGLYEDVMATYIADYEEEFGVNLSDDIDDSSKTEDGSVSPIVFIIAIPVVIVGFLILVKRLIAKR